MKKLLAALVFCLTFAAAVWLIAAYKNPEAAEAVFGNENFKSSMEGSFEAGLQAAGDREAAENYLQEKLPKVKKALADSLKTLGIEDPQELKQWGELLRELPAMACEEIKKWAETEPASE